MNKHHNSYFGRRELLLPPFDGNSQSETYNALISVWGNICANSKEHAELWDIYKGDQAILTREKAVRPEICNRVVENRLWEAIQQHLGYTFSKPVQYTNASITSSNVDVLNKYSRLDQKQGKDISLAELMLVGGTAFRVCLPNARYNGEPDEIPYWTESVGGDIAFVAYSNDIKREPVLCGQHYYTKDKDGVCRLFLSCYTREKYFEFTFDTGRLDAGGFSVVETENRMGVLPIVEYRLNPARLGYIDLGLPLADAINNATSNRLDGVEQFIQSLLWTNNVKQLSNKESDELVSASGGIIQTSDIDANFKAHIQFLGQELDQANTQTLKDDLLDSFYSIVGVPNRNSKASGGDSGSAVELRNGWANLEARAKTMETWFVFAEMQYLKIMLKYCYMFTASQRELGGLTLANIAVSIPRNPNDNMLVKAQSIQMLIETGVDPEDAIECGALFPDSAAVVRKSEEFHKQIGRNWGKTPLETSENSENTEEDSVNA